MAATLPADVNHLESHGVLVSNWELACSLVEDASLELRLPLFQLWLPPACLPVSGGEMGWSTAASSPFAFS